MNNEDPARQKPSWNVSEALYLMEAIARLKKEMEHIPEPNEGRIQELKESIRKGTLITDEVIREVAHKMAHIFLNPAEEE